MVGVIGAHCWLLGLMVVVRIGGSVRLAVRCVLIEADFYYGNTQSISNGTDNHEQQVGRHRNK